MTHDPTKAANLRATCKRVGTTRLARLIGVHPSLLRKKAAGKVGITQRDEVAIEQALSQMAKESAAVSVVRSSCERCGRGKNSRYHLRECGWG